MSHQLAGTTTSNWVYTTIKLLDANRILRPTHVSSDRVIFETPPRLTTPQVEIVITNGTDELRTLVEVLPHDSEMTEIPIRIIASL